MNEKLKVKLLPAVFILFIFTFLIMLVCLPKSTFSENEKRVLSPFPVFSAESLKNGAFTDKAEKYLSDHFPLRSFFVGVNAYEKQFLGQNGQSGIYSAKEGYLITGPSEFDEKKCLKNADCIEKFAVKSGIPTYVLVVPEAGYTLEEKLPRNHKKYYDGEIFSSVESSTPSTRFIDVRKSFAASENQLYYKTDHHLTSSGAMLLYNEFCKSSNQAAAEFTLSKTEGGFYGTTYSKSALWLTSGDEVEIYKCNSGNGYTVTIDDGKGAKKYDSLYFENHLNEKDKYPVFLDGNHAFVRIRNENSGNGKKLLLIKDSYAHCFATFAAENYEEIVMIDLRYYRKSLKKLISEESFTEALILYGAENISTSTDLAWILM